MVLSWMHLHIFCNIFMTLWLIYLCPELDGVGSTVEIVCITVADGSHSDDDECDRNDPQFTVTSGSANGGHWSLPLSKIQVRTCYTVVVADRIVMIEQLCMVFGWRIVSVAEYSSQKQLCYCIAIVPIGLWHREDDAREATHPLSIPEIIDKIIRNEKSETD